MTIRVYTKSVSIHVLFYLFLGLSLYFVEYERQVGLSLTTKRFYLFIFSLWHIDVAMRVSKSILTRVGYCHELLPQTMGNK